jgi:hypothetical protein
MPNAAMSDKRWPKITDKGGYVMYSDPPMGIGMSIEKASKNGYCFQLLMLQRIDAPELGTPYEFWLGTN